MSVGKNSISRVASTSTSTAKKATQPKKKEAEAVITPVELPVATEVTIAAPAKKPAAKKPAEPAKKPVEKEAPKAPKAPAKKRGGNEKAVRIGEELPVDLL